jgi:hypothetical protein
MRNEGDQLSLGSHVDAINTIQKQDASLILCFLFKKVGTW